VRHLCAMALALAGCNAISGLHDYEVVDTTASTSGVGAEGGMAGAGGGSGGSGAVGGGGGSGGTAPMPCATSSECPSEACVDGTCATVLQVATGTGAACAVIAGGRAFCWGDNNDGQLGNGTAMQSFVPTEVQLGGIAAITLARRTDGAGAHACALLESGEVACWGRNGFGQLGLGTTGASQPIATVIPSLAGALQIATGRYHTCASTDAGLFCWGRNDRGQVGQPQGNNVPSPVQVLPAASAIALGTDFTCAVLGSGTVSCWGANDRNQLGDGSGQDSATPIPVVGPMGITAVAAGRDFACAQAGADMVWCWGDNQDGQLALGNNQGPRPPTPVPMLTQIVALSLGVQAGGSTTGGHACATRADGIPRCWGQNAAGQLGNGSNNDSPFPIDVSAIADVVEVATGVDFTCARLAAGGLRCWGRGSEGQLGVGMAVGNQPVPVAVVWP
jgi:alpha-tubulin suppressor-like RCC1 family protein